MCGRIIEKWPMRARLIKAEVEERFFAQKAGKEEAVLAP